MAKFEEALAGMRKGEKWREISWSARSFIEVGDNTFRDEEGERYYLGLMEVMEGDWERHEEPKKSLTLEEAEEALYEGRAVRVDLPEISGSRRTHTFRRRDMHAYLAIDLAERRGWHMEEAE